MSKPLEVFISYSHADRAAKQRLLIFLDVMKRQDKIVIWHDGNILPGGKASQESILEKVVDSDILLYLVSADSLASENCRRELIEAVQANIEIIPIILNYCDWLHHQLKEFQALPDGDTPISKWSPEDEGWQKVVEGIRKVVDTIQTEREDIFDIVHPANDAIQQGNTMMMGGQIERAIEYYSRAIELEPDKVGSYNNRGVAYYNKGDYACAIKDYTKAIELRLNYAIAYYNRGMAYREKGEFDSTIVDLTKSLELAPDNALAYANRAVVYLIKGKIDLVIVDSTKAIELAPNLAIAYANRAIAYGVKGEYNRSITDSTKAIELDSALALAYYNRGKAYSEKSEHDRAVVDYTKAIELDTDYIEAYHARGLTYHETGEFQRSIEDFTKLIQMFPFDIKTYTYNIKGYQLRSRSYKAIGNHERAQADIDEAERLKRLYPPVTDERMAKVRGVTGEFELINILN